MMGAKQVKVGLRVRDLQASGDLYLRLGFREIPNDDQPNLRYLTFGHTWLILSDMYAHEYNRPEEEQAVQAGPLGLGFALALPTPDLDTAYDLWRREGLPVVSEPQDTAWARTFAGQDLDGYEVVFEQFHDEYRP
ncbi:VOC family protein [Streptomyces venezuelae]|uniref:VOC family protein n=1 Tax=Streptomyces venezuelae TaxID=54571 RepID=UPI00331E31E5